MNRSFLQAGFTLIELIVGISIIAILALIIFVAIDPSRRIKAANNTTRASHVNAILNAYLNYVADNKGTHVTSTSSGVTYMIGTGGGSGTCAASTTSAKVVLTGVVDSYLTTLPYDPVSGNSEETRYYYYKSPYGRIRVGACDPETEGTLTPSISVQR
ncbi:MAG: hypothetical protein HW383_31 [Candidatus Magasanikbacteria bacterium]|nr:hypothetical protein [Candidatus Magasanikbacteria bacterium]